MMHTIALFVFCSVLSAITVRYAIIFALANNITDHPGEHKQHDASIPFIGGVGVLVALCVALAILVTIYPELLLQWLTLGLCSIIIFATGFADDVIRLNYKPRLIIQAVVALIMILIGKIVLSDLGELFFGLPLQLGLFGIPFTVFAVIGVINALNMIDGIDGLSGSVSLVSLLLIGVIAFIAGDSHNSLLIIALAGGVVGFLYFNLRHSSQSRARAFLGDNGSMLLGFLFAWLLIDLSQDPDPAMKPVTAIWLLSIPLMDAVSVMHRRMWVGKSPFIPDHNHLHHILLRAGYRIEEVVFTIASLHLLFGMIGLAGLYLGVSDFIMLLAFLLAYLGYFYLTLSPWHYIPVLCFLHTRLHLTPNASRGTFFGNHTRKYAEGLTRVVSKELKSGIDYWVQVFEQQSVRNDSKKCYAVALNIRLPKEDYSSDEKSRQYAATVPRQLERRQGIRLRQLVARHSDNERREINSESVFDDELHGLNRRIADRRSLGSRVLVFEVTQGMHDKALST